MLEKFVHNYNYLTFEIFLITINKPVSYISEKMDKSFDLFAYRKVNYIGMFK